MTASGPTTEAAFAVAYAERVIGDRYYWSLSRGRLTANDPLWCFAVWNPQDAARDEVMDPIASREDDNPLRATVAVLMDLGFQPERVN